jgi:hypothetical protein
MGLYTNVRYISDITHISSYTHIGKQTLTARMVWFSRLGTNSFKNTRILWSLVQDLGLVWILCNDLINEKQIWDLEIDRK